MLLLPLVLAHGPEGYRSHHLSRAGHVPEGIMAYSVNYTIGTDVFEGYVAYPTGVSGYLPGVMIVHQWYGLGENEMYRAEEAAQHGYIAFANDMYGFGQRATNNGEAAALMNAVLGDPALLSERSLGGLAQLMPGGVAYDVGPTVNQSAIVANGYCFGGNVVLQLARDGASVQGIAAFHPTFPSLVGWADPTIGVQIHHGQYDFSGDAALYAAQDELSAYNVTEWESAYYGNAFHGFSDILADAYYPRVAMQSHASMFSFYDGLLGHPECHDSASWYKNGDTSKDCAWVASFVPTRCTVKGEGRVLAYDACPVACGSC